MTITLIPEWQEWWAEAAKNSLQNPSEPFEFYCQLPRQLGKGYERNTEVYPQVWLGISNYEYYDDVLYQIVAKEALLDFQTIAQGIMAKPNADLEAWFSTSE
ncbi:hypothetical protein [Nostoc sp.]|uniref:hypothetical protein n=1 Tax=Nostoc sp. TaxID=1180 RepID=UPI002FF553E8